MRVLIRLLTSVAAIGLLTLPCAVFAHHSTSEYGSTVIEIDGVVSDKFWKNPHVIFNVTTDDGEVWVIEGGSVSNQDRRGIGSDVINMGDRLKVAGRSSSRRVNNMNMSNILLDNGQELMLSRNGTPRWPDVEQHQVSFSGPTAAQIAEAEANADGLFRIWSFGSQANWFFKVPETYNVTEAALEKFATWDEYTENPQLVCIPPGMPITMGNPYPIEFTQHDENTIVMRAHEFDVTRVIHLNAKAVPTVADTHMGYSTGYWEDEHTFIVDTTNINYPYFNRVGISSGPDLTVHERFAMAEDFSRIDYTTTVTDPWALNEPYSVDLLWTWVPGQELGSYDCAVSEVYAQ